MKTNLLTFCIFLGSFFSISLAYGDDIPTQGRWDDERLSFHHGVATHIVHK